MFLPAAGCGVSGRVDGMNVQGSYRTLEGGIYFQAAIYNLAGGTNRRYGSQLWSVRLASVVSELACVCSCLLRGNIGVAVGIPGVR